MWTRIITMFYCYHLKRPLALTQSNSCPYWEKSLIKINNYKQDKYHLQHLYIFTRNRFEDLGSQHQNNLIHCSHISMCGHFEESHKLGKFANRTEANLELLLELNELVVIENTAKHPFYSYSNLTHSLIEFCHLNRACKWMPRGYVGSP